VIACNLHIVTSKKILLHYEYLIIVFSQAKVLHHFSDALLLACVLLCYQYKQVFFVIFIPWLYWSVANYVKLLLWFC